MFVGAMKHTMVLQIKLLLLFGCPYNNNTTYVRVQKFRNKKTLQGGFCS